MPEIDKIENSIHSEEVQDIIGKVPHWILRYGIVLIFLILLGLLIGAYFIQYPDTLTAKAVITAEHPPIAIYPKINGKLKQLFVSDNQDLEANQMIGILESNVSYDSILKLKMALQLDLVDSISVLSLDSMLLLHTCFGEADKISSASANFEEAVKNYIYQYTNHSTAQKIANANKQILFQARLQHKLINQTKLSNDKLNFEQQKFNAHQYLNENKVIAPIEFNEIQKGLIDQKMSYESFAASIISNELNIEQLKQIILTLKEQETEKKNNALIKLQQSRQLLIADIENWEKQYVLKSPESGKVVFAKAWAENQDLSTADIAFFIVSPMQHIMAKATVPIYKSAKMKIGQTVNLKLANYPFEQYGILRGSIANIASIPINDSYLITIDLPQNLETTNKKKLVFYPEMKADAQVILKEERLLIKLLLKFKRELDT